MPRMPKTKIELKNTLPSDPVERDRLKKVILEGVEARIMKKDASDMLKDIVSVEKESHGYDPKFINAMINALFDRQYQEGKKRKDLEEKIEQMAEVDILFGREG